LKLAYFQFVVGVLGEAHSMRLSLNAEGELNLLMLLFLLPLLLMLLMLLMLLRRRKFQDKDDLYSASYRFLE
jgi:hypothetical protein